MSGAFTVGRDPFVETLNKSTTRHSYSLATTPKPSW